MTSSNINFTSGIPVTELSPFNEEALSLLNKSLDLESQERHSALSEIIKKWPDYVAAWAYLGDNARDDVEAYAAYRVGYHRGLDELRKSGWRGSGYVKWEHEPNRGFLKALNGLRVISGKIGEVNETERCAEFLKQLDPSFNFENLTE